jgi:hypothetical protein
MTTESININIDKITSRLSIELENLRQAALKRDRKKVEEAILRQEELFTRLRVLIQADTNSEIGNQE